MDKNYEIMTQNFAQRLVDHSPFVFTPKAVSKLGGWRTLWPSLRWRTHFSLTARHAGSLPRSWQLRFYDFNVWSLKKRVEKLHYMRVNPLKRTLVAHPKQWPWSSFLFYSKGHSGLIRIDPIR